MFTSTTHFKAVVAAGAAVALLTAGCATNTSTPSNPSSASTSPGMTGSMPGMDHGNSASPSASAATRTDFNDADVTFLQMMYPHHAQAVEMAQLVPGRSQNQEVLTLAANIENAQGPEMAQISALLTSFGKPAPTPDAGHMTAMPGMMAPDQMNTLKGLSGKEFDRMWLQMMIQHHTGAITMSNTEIASGANPDAKILAHKIITNQQAEMDQMNSMLAQT
jgi:uncharacterized protein (DUF305 family)